MLNRSVPFPSSDDAIHYVSALSDDEILTTKDGVMVEHSRRCSYQIRTWKSKQDREKGVPATPFINDKGESTFSFSLNGDHGLADLLNECRIHFLTIQPKRAF